MRQMLQLNPPIPLTTPKGEGLAVLVIDYGPDFDLLWTVIVSNGEHAGEVWTYANPDVRGVENVTLGRPATAPPSIPPNTPPAMAHAYPRDGKPHARNGRSNGRANGHHRHPPA
jgi:hypothetical protein